MLVERAAEYFELDRSSPYMALVANVREVSPSSDPVTRTYRVKCTLPGQPPGWRLGLNAIVTLEAGRPAPGIRIPSTALYEKNRKSAVWIVRDDQTIELRPIGEGDGVHHEIEAAPGRLHGRKSRQKSRCRYCRRYCCCRRRPRVVPFLAPT